MNPLSKQYQTRRADKLVNKAERANCPKCRQIMGCAQSTYVCVRCGDEYDQNLVLLTKTKNKFNAEATSDGDRRFGSGLEREVGATLKLMERSGQIRTIRYQQDIRLMPSVKHKIDFIVFDNVRGTDVGVEAKGKEDSRWQVIQQMYQDLAPIPIQVWIKERGRVFKFKEIPVGGYVVVARESVNVS